jgi:hypothetical protein
MLEGAALRKIAAASATFVLLNLSYLLVELHGLPQNGLTIAADTQDETANSVVKLIRCAREV